MVAPESSMTSPWRRQFVTWASAANKFSSPLWRSGTHCVGCTGPGTMLIEIFADGGLTAQARAPEIDRGRAVGVNLDDRHALGAGHRRHIQHQFAIVRESALAGGGRQNERK